MKLTTDNVKKVFFGCMYNKDEIKDIQDIPHGSIVVEGSKSRVVFDPASVKASERDIASLISQLRYSHDNKEDLPMLDFHLDEDGEEWGNNESIEQLMIIGKASGYIGRLKIKDEEPSNED